MATHANIIFASNYDNRDVDNLDKCVSQDFDYVKHGNQIYLHFDGSPKYIIPLLKSFLKSEGAKIRRDDNSYLSAWFVTYYCMDTVRYLINPSNIDFYDYNDYYTPNFEDIFNVEDFRGIGLHNGEMADDINYTYVITNRDITTFNVWIYDAYKFIDVIPVNTNEV